MCVNGIDIKNNSKQFVPFYTKAHLNVPCGHCPECHKQVADEWFLRTVRELEDCNSKGGKSIFTTLTFNNKYLPHFDDDPNNPSCFSYEIVHKFIRSQEKWLERHLKDFKYGEDLRFIFYPERGSDDLYFDKYHRLRKATERPHYHIFEFFSRDAIETIWLDHNHAAIPCSMEQAVQMFIERFWKKEIKIKEDVVVHLKTKDKIVQKVVRKYEPYGDVRWSDRPRNCRSGVFVESEEACIYGSKYACKDLSFYESTSVREFLSTNGEIDKEKIHKYRHCLPRHYQSFHFGLSLLDDLGHFEDKVVGVSPMGDQLTEKVFVPNANIDTLVTEGNDFGFSVDIRKGKSKKYKYPRYITDKILKEYRYLNDQDESPTRVDTELGKRIKIDNQRYVLYNYEQKVKSMFEVSNLEKWYKSAISFDVHHIPSPLNIFLTEVYCGELQFVDFHSFHRKLLDLLGDRDFHDLSVFNNLAKGVYVPTDVFEGFECMPMEFLHGCLHDLYVARVNEELGRYEIFYDPNGFCKTREFDLIDNYSYTDLGLLPQFHDLSLLIRLINQFYGLYRKDCHLSYLKQRREKKALNRAIYNQFHNL